MENKFNGILIVWIAFSMALLTSCSRFVYVPDSLEGENKKELAFLGMIYGSLSSPGDIVSIDDVEMPPNDSIGIYVKPGLHTIEFRYQRKGFRVEPEIRRCKIEFKSGKKYEYSYVVKNSYDCTVLGYY